MLAVRCHARITSSHSLIHSLSHARALSLSFSLTLSLSLIHSLTRQGYSIQMKAESITDYTCKEHDTPISRNPSLSNSRWSWRRFPDLQRSCSTHHRPSSTPVFDSGARGCCFLWGFFYALLAHSPVPSLRSPSLPRRPGRPGLGQTPCRGQGHHGELRWCDRRRPSTTGHARTAGRVSVKRNWRKSCLSLEFSASAAPTEHAPQSSQLLQDVHSSPGRVSNRPRLEVEQERQGRWWAPML